MRDAPAIAAGVVVFLALALAPVWQRAAAGPAEVTRPKIARPDTRCVAPRSEIRASHMQLLDGWRDAVVRHGKRQTVDQLGTPIQASLTGTCLECHGAKKDFCDGCHGQLAVQPVCWDCHHDPKERP